MDEQNNPAPSGSSPRREAWCLWTGQVGKSSEAQPSGGPAHCTNRGMWRRHSETGERLLGHSRGAGRLGPLKDLEVRQGAGWSSEGQGWERGQEPQGWATQSSSWLSSLVTD